MLDFGWSIGIVLHHRPSGSSSAVERQLPKLDVTGSIPVSRSIFFDYSAMEPENYDVPGSRVDSSFECTLVSVVDFGHGR
jgi:hypothetical protein